MSPRPFSENPPMRGRCVRPLLAVLLLVLLAPACETVPITGRSQLNLLSEPDEIQVARVAQRIIAAVQKPSCPGGRR